MEPRIRTAERIEDALREIAVLFIALAPLDVFLGEGTVYAVRNGLIFVAVGLMIFCTCSAVREETVQWMIS
jgi:hypothetical protein